MASPSPDGRIFIVRLCLIALLLSLFWLVETSHLPFRVRGTVDLEPAITALHAKDVTGARAIFDKMLARQPASPALYEDICAVCGQAGQWDLLVEYAQRGVQQCKNAPPADRAALYSQLAVAYTEIEKTPHQENALLAAHRAQELDPLNPMTQNGLGYILADNDRNLDVAQALITQALKSARQHSDDPMMEGLIPQIEDSYGWLLYKRQSYPAAVDTLTQAIQDLPEGAQGTELKYFYYHLGAALHAAGRNAEARPALRTALHYDPQFAEAKAELEALPPNPAVSPSSPPAAAPSPPKKAAPLPSQTPTKPPALPSSSSLLALPFHLCLQ
jgi:tetratricopeptide (TPR) repeat protein